VTLFPTSSPLCGTHHSWSLTLSGSVMPPGIYTFWKEAQPLTVGTHTDFKRFTSRKKR